ncbi:FKBP-type peptidyl-prolyl cis-trans isomerase [Sinomicrobium sp. M5D2P17]
MMKINRLGLVVMGAIVLLGACRNDDNGGGVEVRDPAEVATENDADIREYLSTHFYNYEEFKVAAEQDSTDFDFRIVIDTIAGENSDKTPMIDQVEVKTIAVEITEEETLDHKLYSLVARQGNSDSLAPKTTDSTLVRYKGFLLNDFIFDNSNAPVWFNLSNNIRGFSEFMPVLNSGGKIDINEEDGTYIVSGNYGIGMVFMPAALGYYSGSGSIPAYTPIAFSVDLLKVRVIKEEEEED